MSHKASPDLMEMMRSVFRCSDNRPSSAFVELLTDGLTFPVTDVLLCKKADQQGEGQQDGTDEARLSSEPIPGIYLETHGRDV